MIEQDEVLKFPTPEVRTSEATIVARYFLAGVALFGSAYAGAGVAADISYGADKAANLLELNGYTNPRYLDTDHIFVSFKGCDTSDEIKYDFEATNPNGQDVKISVCRGLGRAAHLPKEK